MSETRGSLLTVASLALILAVLLIRKVLRALSTPERPKPLPNVDWTGW